MKDQDTSIAKRNIPEKINIAIEEAGMLLSIGDMFFDGDGSRQEGNIIRISDIKKDAKEIRIHYDSAQDWELTEWRQYGSSGLKEFKNRFYEFKLIKPIEEYMDDVQKIISGELSIDSFKDKGTEEINMSTALVGRGSKEFLNNMQSGLETSKNKTAMVRRALAYEMERRKQELDKIREGLGLILKDFEKKITKIVRLITTIELYLGIEEELVQIQDGEKCPSNETLYFRQMVLHMDEETGIYKGGGLDFQDVAVFDKWLTTDRNFEKVIPEKKGVVVLNPRRHDKDYGETSYYTQAKNQANRYDTYILVRNGECLSRIFSEKISIRDRLFPLRKEFDEMIKEIDEEKWERDKDEKQEMMENMTYQYQKRAMLLQGLIDRTDVFSPMDYKLSLFKLHEAPDGVFQFIYDAEASLPTGRKSFWDWHKDINSKITEGSRVFFTGHYSRDCFYKRNFYPYSGSNNRPNSGVYVVEEYYAGDITEYLPHYYAEELEEKGLMIKKVIELQERFGKGWEEYDYNPQLREGVKLRTFKSGKDPFGKGENEYIEAYKCTYKDMPLTILYNPMDTVDGSWGDYDPHTRKKRIRLRIKPYDKWMLNYDQIDIEDIDFYLSSRVDRPNYLDMMPVLVSMKKQMLIEKKSEDYFAEMVFGLNMGKGWEENELKAKIQDAIAWWKYKNKWKRPIDKDDAKALRMIQSRLKKK